jgi:hypothetical protein
MASLRTPHRSLRKWRNAAALVAGANTPLRTWEKAATLTPALRLKAGASLAKNFLDRLKKWPRILGAMRP